MQYSNLGWVVLVIVVLLLSVFHVRPWKQIFVYPRKSTRGKLFYIQSSLWILSLFLVVGWSFHIRVLKGSVPMHAPTGHIMFLLDGSLSMSASDIAPSRFNNATHVISALISGNTNSDFGLIVFSGLPVIRIPWSNDIVGIQNVIGQLKLGDFPPTSDFLGTALGDALLLSLHQFQSNTLDESRSIVVISDGDSNKGYDPYKVLPLLREQHIPLYFLAVGNEGYEVGKDMLGLPVNTSFNKKLMEEFTMQTNGKLYINPRDSEVDQLRDMLIQAANSKMANRATYVPYFFSFNTIISELLIICFVLLIAACCCQIFYAKRVK